MFDQSESNFFSNKPFQFELFKKIKQFINSLGLIKTKITKSQISFANKRQFAWVWFPMPWDNKRPKNSLVLSFSLGEKISHPEIVQVVEPYPGRFIHHVIIKKESDINGNIKKWLKEAYNFSGNNSKSH